MEAVVQVQLRLPVTFTQEGDYVVAHFPHLDIASQGRNRDQAAQNLIEATQVFIESCFERGVLDEVLKACGFTPGRPAVESTQNDHLTVPFELLAARNGASAHCY